MAGAAFAQRRGADRGAPHTRRKIVRIGPEPRALAEPRSGRPPRPCLRSRHDRLSLSTEIVTGQGGWQRNDTRLGWNLARGADADSKIVWSAAAGGNLPAAGAAEQTGEAVLGYRLQPLDIVTLTTEIALAGRYTFATQNGLAGSLTPRVKVVADLTQPLAMPWRTTLDVSLGRQVPMVGRDIQTSGTALLKLELPTH